MIIKAMTAGPAPSPRSSRANMSSRSRPGPRRSPPGARQLLPSRRPEWTSRSNSEGRQGPDYGADAAPRSAAQGGAGSHSRPHLQTGGVEIALVGGAQRGAWRRAESRPDLRAAADHPAVVERARAGFGAWYEMVPRSQSRIAGAARHVRGLHRRVPEIAALGFDVLYLHANPSHRPHQSQGQEQLVERRRRRSGEPLRHGDERAVITRSIRRSGPLKISAAW